MQRAIGRLQILTGNATGTIWSNADCAAPLQEIYLQGRRYDGILEGTANVVYDTPLESAGAGEEHWMKTILIVIVAAVVLCVARPGILTLVRGDRGATARSVLIQEKNVIEPVTAETEHFSPKEDLEALDIGLLRQAHTSIDVAMYAFTDRRVAVVLRQLASQRIRIRIYRDQEQFENEQQHATLREASTAQLLRGMSTVHIRVKQGSPRDLMHLKEVLIDREILRDGSANWSPGALCQQDNGWFFTRDRQKIYAFAAEFEDIWNRTSNLVIQ